MKKKKTAQLSIDFPIQVLRTFQGIADEVGCTTEQAILVVLLLELTRIKTKDVK